MGETPSRPERHVFENSERIGKLVRNVRSAICALPAYFQSGTRLEGLDGGELFSLSGVLGGAIEHQVVETLNRIRGVWDPDDEWPRHTFVRYSQTFPDVRLQAYGDEELPSVALGIELKGWYLLSKEGEPSFRYTVTPQACAEPDLLVVVPWHLKNLLSGEPVVHEPFIEQARYVAELRNWWWTYERQSKDAESDRQIYPPDETVTPYPAAKTKIADRPAKDGGNNFGRIARVDLLMQDYVKQMLGKSIAGIPAEHWMQFFRLHAEARDPQVILSRLETKLEGQNARLDREIAEAMRHIVNLFR
ncbi:MAG: hypothetical protein OXF31_09100 [Gammaproteobacteria bacterium]|nr:hypothetical protein [Gammaproteobacteria bacterium]